MYLVILCDVACIEPQPYLGVYYSTLKKLLKSREMLSHARVCIVLLLIIVLYYVNSFMVHIKIDVLPK